MVLKYSDIKQKYNGNRKADVVVRNGHKESDINLKCSTFGIVNVNIKIRLLALK